jgi:hypothetical protein
MIRLSRGAYPRIGNRPEPVVSNDRSRSAQPLTLRWSRRRRCDSQKQILCVSGTPNTAHKYLLERVWSLTLERFQLRDELGMLLSEWDDKLAGTPEGKRAHLLETLGTRSVIERTRRQPQARPTKGRGLTDCREAGADASRRWRRQRSSQRRNGANGGRTEKRMWFDSSLDRAPRGHARGAESSPFRLRSLRFSVVNSALSVPSVPGAQSK